MNLNAGIGLVALLVIFTIGLLGCSHKRVFVQPNSAMEPTILKDEKVVVNMVAYHDKRPARGDVVVFKHDGLLIVKRVIAVVNDTIEGQNFQVVLNGKTLQENYVQHQGESSAQGQFFYLKTFKPETVPAGEVFVMGDNRDYSHDSRDPGFGAVSVQDVVGKAVRIFRSEVVEREGKIIE